MAKNFKDINFKLAVIQELMYNQEVLEPAFSIDEFVESYEKREIDIEKEGYDPIPEALDYFRNLEIPDSLLSLVKEISQDGGDEIYLEICPFWDGEDDGFNITSTEDVKLVPNLKKITLFYDDAEKMVSEFEKLGIKAEYL